MKLKRSYTSINLDEAHPGTGTKKEWFPIVWVRLGANHQKTPRFPAVLDTGSPVCLFRADWADYLKVDLSRGKVGEIGGIVSGAKGTAIYQPIQVYIEDETIVTLNVGFSKKLSVPGILGRRGFFDTFRVTFDHSISPPFFELERIDRPV